MLRRLIAALIQLAVASMNIATAAAQTELGITFHQTNSRVLDLSLTANDEVRHLLFDQRFGGLLRIGSNRLIRFDRDGNVTLERPFDRDFDYLDETGRIVSSFFFPDGDALFLLLKVDDYHTQSVRVISENGSQLDRQATANRVCGKDLQVFSYFPNRNYRIGWISDQNSISDVLYLGGSETCDTSTMSLLSNKRGGIIGFDFAPTIGPNNQIQAAVVERVVLRDLFSGIDIVGDNVYISAAVEPELIGPLASHFTFHEVTQFRAFDDLSIIAGNAQVSTERGDDAFFLFLDARTQEKIAARYVDFGHEYETVTHIFRKDNAVAALVSQGRLEEDGLVLACVNISGDVLAEVDLKQHFGHNGDIIGAQDDGQLYFGFKEGSRYRIDLFRFRCPTT